MDSNKPMRNWNTVRRNLRALSGSLLPWLLVSFGISIASVSWADGSGVIPDPRDHARNVYACINATRFEGSLGCNIPSAQELFTDAASLQRYGQPGDVQHAESCRQACNRCCDAGDARANEFDLGFLAICECIIGQAGSSGYKFSPIACGAGITTGWLDYVAQLPPEERPEFLQGLTDNGVFITDTTFNITDFFASVIRNGVRGKPGNILRDIDAHHLAWLDTFFGTCGRILDGINSNEAQRCRDNCDQHYRYPRAPREGPEPDCEPKTEKAFGGGALANIAGGIGGQITPYLTPDGQLPFWEGTTVIDDLPPWQGPPDPINTNPTGGLPEPPPIGGLAGIIPNLPSPKPCHGVCCEAEGGGGGGGNPVPTGNCMTEGVVIPCYFLY